MKTTKIKAMSRWYFIFTIDTRFMIVMTAEEWSIIPSLQRLDPSQDRIFDFVGPWA
jgi:hypothetical protein